MSSTILWVPNLNKKREVKLITNSYLTDHSVTYYDKLPHALLPYLLCHDGLCAQEIEDKVSPFFLIFLLFPSFYFVRYFVIVIINY